ncbi:MAG: serine/threonine-protein kinase [Flavobacteriales bacterium]
MPLGLHTASLNFETMTEVGQEGKNSEVYLAHDKQLDGEIVVKKIAKSRISNALEYYRESKILHASTHSNVVRINYGCSDGDYIYIAMPYYRKGSLKKLIDKRFLTIRDVLRYSIQFLSGLNHIHSKGLIHFDIKPDNILISDNNEALLSDFGLAKAMNTLGLASPDLVYPKQVPPETFSADEKTIQFDIYLAGLTIYRLVNGNEHFNGQLNFPSREDYLDAIVKGMFPNRDSYLPHVPHRLKTIINKALSVNTSDRHANVLELMNELSLVDENLDWQYEIDGTNQMWTRDEADKTIVVCLDGSTFDIHTTKEIHSNGRKTRVTDHCHKGLTRSNYVSKLRKALRS